MKMTSRTSLRSLGFTLMEILVVIAIILVLAAIAFPVFATVQNKANRNVAMNNMRQLGSAAGAYSSQNDGQLPAEDSKGSDNWAAATLPENAKAWYNALPVLLNNKSVAQYASNPQAYYSKENLLFLPGAKYPESEKKLAAPLFALAINSKLQKKSETGDKSARLSQLANPARTVLFLESGIKGEEKAMKQQPKYDGAPKGSAKSFVARYNGFGCISFVDGHVEMVEGKDILTQTGDIPWKGSNPPAQPGDILWGKSLEDDPN